MATRLHRELMRSPIARTGVGCLSMLCLILTFVAGFATWRRLQEARITTAWTQTTGTIEQTGIDETMSSGQIQYAPRIAYVFRCEGKTFRGHQIDAHDQTFSSRLAAQEAGSAFAIGAAVTVYYDPEDPTHAVLRPGAQRMDYLLLGLPLVLLFFAYGFFQMLQRSKATPISTESD